MPEPTQQSRPTPRPRPARSLATVLVVASLGLLGGCAGSSDEPSGSAVASVASVPRTSASGSTATTATTATTAERPLIRIDTSPEEVDLMYEVYTKCLTDRGVPSKEDLVRSKQARSKFESGAYKTAIDACAAQEPEDYQQREKREDPSAFKDHQLKQIKCMREHGLAIETGPDGWGYTNPARDMGSAWDKKCEQEAFGS